MGLDDHEVSEQQIVAGDTKSEKLVEEVIVLFQETDSADSSDMYLLVGGGVIGGVWYCVKKGLFKKWFGK